MQLARYHRKHRYHGHAHTIFWANKGMERSGATRAGCTIPQNRLELRIALGPFYQRYTVKK
eukprot:SAG11_NODE_2116_length_3792_cov_5.166802_4_plen_61_part_00